MQCGSTSNTEGWVCQQASAALADGETELVLKCQCFQPLVTWQLHEGAVVSHFCLSMSAKRQDSNQRCQQRMGSI
jgi:hypothetical protein